MTVIDVRRDNVERGYRIVALDDGRFALVWGDVRARVGDTLADTAAKPTAEAGVEFFDAYEAAEAEMLAAL